ncbi:thioesterase family protein [Parasphingopyxis sp.]|uniref:acyl-CoA thioesterase n=1 Tax=Parasphingopyxis sp. TaxID=1920299 RepID=UPI00261E320F|nr:thioesterase family protein [Parasphingopyxis sp.]
MKYILDTETKLRAHGDGAYSRAMTEIFWNMDSAFGGWAIALALGAVTREAGVAGTLANINAVFVSAIQGGTVFVRVETLRSGKRTSFYRSELRQDTLDGPLVFSADIVLSDRQETDLAYQPVMPEVKAPEDTERLAFPPGMGPRWFGHFDQRIVIGAPFTVQDRPRSAVWIRDGDGRPLDSKGLAAISDVPMPRAFFLADTPRFSSTVSYSFFQFATEDELAAIGNDHILVESDSNRVRRGMSDQHTRIWSQDGALLALTSQIAFFR